jgi:cytochrome c553
VRGGDSAALMKGVVAKLTDEDMIALAAYVASRKP